MANTQPTLPAVDPGDGDPARPATPWIGRTIDGRYRVVELLGEGGMGAVFVAEHLRLRKQVALKTIRAEFAAHSQAEQRFEREALATAQLDHPHIASAMDYGHLPEGGAYLVIQLVRGQSLAKRLEAGPLPWPQACELGAQIADALAAAHAAGIIHRDLKPDNILLEHREGTALHARVVDFGIARVSGEGGGAIADAMQPITRMGGVIGTPGYMAPEQAVGQQVDLRVDLYALGVIVWECVAGRTLWQADTLTELFAGQLSRPAPSLGTVAPVPEALAALVDRLLARNADERPEAAAPVRDELRRLALLGGPAVTAIHPPPTVRPSPTAATAYDVTLAGLQGPPTMLSPGTGAPATGRGPIPRFALWAGGVTAAVIVLALALGGGHEAGPTAGGGGQGGGGGGAATAASTAGGRRGLPTIEELVAEVPATYQAEAKILLAGRSQEARSLAGQTIAGAPEADKPSIPEYIRNLAWLEKVSSCDTKLSILTKIDAQGDVRALPALKIVAETPTDGCREWFSRSDCLSCLRGDLARTIARFEVMVGG